ncbi:hypothetical protein [Nocardia sp. NPDC057030]|uniref:hypothetical protein n=1 Tax=unclassified Nocardia TaxID=2637762 RepID=UPI00363A7E46
MRRFWIEFDLDGSYCAWPPLAQGVGVTGYDARDCLTLVAAIVRDGPLPPVRRITVDISLAEPLPVNPPHLGVPVWRGVWYPADNLSAGPTLRSVGRTGEHFDFPAPISAPPRRPRASETLGAQTTWWDEIPHIRGLLWPLVQLHSARYCASMPMAAPVIRDTVARDSAYATMLRDALDFMIAWHPTPDEWSDPTGIRFDDQQELDDYLQAFRDYLFGGRADPIYPAGRNHPPPEIRADRPGT